MQKSNLLKNLLVVSNILIFICLILVLTLQTKFTYSLYWTLVPFLIVLIVSFIHEVDKGIVNKDIDKSKAIKRTYDDSTVIATVFYAFIYLLIEFVDTLNDGFRNNLYIIIGFLVITFVYELFIYISINNAKKETSKLLKKK